MIYDRGYLFSRKTWDPHTPQSSYLTLRFGQSRQHQVHGQDDATDVTFYALGKEQLWGDGVFGDDTRYARRTYVLSRRAQNTVDIVGATYNRAVLTPLLWSSHTARYDAAAVSNRTLSGATTVRTVVHAKEAGFLVVDDIVTQSRSRTIIQRWQLGEDRKTQISTKRVSTSGTGSNATLMWVGTGVRLRVAKGQSEPDSPRLAQRRSPAYHAVPRGRGVGQRQTRPAHHGARPSLGVHRPLPDQGHPGAHQRIRPPVRRRHGDRNLPRAHHGALGVGRQAVTAFLPDQTRRPSTIVRIAAIRLPVMPNVRSPIVSL